MSESGAETTPLPSQTVDDLTDPADRLRETEADDDERLRREVPPHHGD